MLTKIAEFIRNHVVVSLLSAAGIGAGTMWSLYEARTNRLEEMKVEALRDIGQENKKFRVLLEQFTFELSEKNVADPEKKKEMSSSLVSLYSLYGSYRSNLPVTDYGKVTATQAAINNVKKKIQTANAKADLEPIGSALVDLFRNQKNLDSALEESVGRAAASQG